MIAGFQGEYRWLSNFWPAEVILDGFAYPTVEHAYVAAKTHNQMMRERVRNAPNPGAAKRMGRHLPLREDWDSAKLRVMLGLTIQKYRHLDLRLRLLATGDAELIEANTWGDRYWGVCDGDGQNWLGKSIMSARDYWRAVQVMGLEV